MNKSAMSRWEEARKKADSQPKRKLTTETVEAALADPMIPKNIKKKIEEARAGLHGDKITHVEFEIGDGGKPKLTEHPFTFTLEAEEKSDEDTMEVTVPKEVAHWFTY